MTNTIAIVGNGNHWKNKQQLVQLLQTYRYIIAADGGANYCRQLNITPDYIIGDGDSVLPSTRVHFKSVPQIQSDDQNTTDVQKILNYLSTTTKLLEPVIDLYCMISVERFDHALSAIHYLCYVPHIRYIYTPWQRLQCLTPQHQLVTLHCPIGTIVSLIPVTAQAQIHLTGVQWSGRQTVSARHQSGVSNRITQPQATVRVVQGTVILMIALNKLTKKTKSTAVNN